MLAPSFDAPRMASRFAHAGAGQAQADVLREAFDEIQAQARALQVLQDDVQKLQEADTRRATQHTEGKANAQVLLNQVKTLEESARQDAKERATKGDMALVRKDMDMLRKDMELLRKDMDAGNMVLRKDMEAGNMALRKDMQAMEQRLDARFDALQNSLIIKLGGMMVLALGAGTALVKMLS